MRPLDRLDVEVNSAVLFLDGGVFGIGEGAGGAIADARRRVRVFAKLTLVGEGFLEVGFVGAELVIDHLPDHFVVLHFGVF